MWSEVEVHVAVGHVLGLVVAVGWVGDARVVLLHGLVLGEGRLLRLQLRVHHVTAHQRLGPAGHGLCHSKHRREGYASLWVLHAHSSVSVCLSV